jgi:hypothetical protein
MASLAQAVRVCHEIHDSVNGKDKKKKAGLSQEARYFLWRTTLLLDQDYYIIHCVRISFYCANAVNTVNTVRILRVQCGPILCEDLFPKTLHNLRLSLETHS